MAKIEYQNLTNSPPSLPGSDNAGGQIADAAHTPRLLWLFFFFFFFFFFFLSAGVSSARFLVPSDRSGNKEDLACTFLMTRKRLAQGAIQ